MNDSNKGALPNQRELIIDRQNIYLRFIEGDEEKKKVEFKAGWEYMINTFFQTEYPDPGKVEKALNYLEYELTGDKSLVNKDEVLLCSNELLTLLLGGSASGVVSRDGVEQVFDKYTDVATGEPAHMVGIDYSIEKFSVILIVRVVMYYLNFKEIKID